LLLGLHDDTGELHHVGVAASFTAARRAELVQELAPLRAGVDASHPWHDWIRHASDALSSSGQVRLPGGQSRWSQAKDLSCEPLGAKRVVEVSCDNMQGTRPPHSPLPPLAE